MAETPDRTESIFAAAVALPDAAERAALLERECANDPSLRIRMEALLRAHDRAGHMLDRPIRNELEQTVGYVANERPGSVIAGRYKLLEAIGEGGMGAVWVAEQTEPVRRKVAIKLIKAGMDSKSVLARFEAERQALAVMDHPNIAKVLDGGLTDAGRPFFVMEYVKGVPITEYCDSTRLGVPERLNLFVQVCHAVQHAHQKGIIHRDLKPSNILVAPYDDRPVPKVIDFGLVKAMHQSLTERTLHTAHETVLGTPLYMSPEQAQLNNLDVDTRSDIYSLGVLLYELLTGTTPLEKQRFKEAAWEEIRRLIREEEPPRPSTRLSSTNTLPSLAVNRHIEPARLTKLVRGELDWIVMKSLEKDRSRRYETANGFALDIERYLGGEPVLAAPPSARYRLRKFARKHRAVLTTTTTIMLLLAGGVALSTWQAVRATRAETAALRAQHYANKAQRAEAERAAGERRAKLDAEAKRVEAERQQSRAEAGEKLASERLAQVDAEKKNAEEEKQISQAVLDFLQNKLLRQADLKSQADALLRSGGLAAVTEVKTNPTILELLDRAAKELTPERIETNFPNQPLVQAGILQTVGNTYRDVGEDDQAIDFLNRSAAIWRQHRGPHDSSTLLAVNDVARAYLSAGKIDLALPLFDELLKLWTAKFGPDHLGTLTAMNNLARAYQSAGKLDLALPLFEETLTRMNAKFGPSHSGTLVTMGNLAIAYRATGKLSLALPLMEETLRHRKAQLGPNHPATLNDMHGLATVYWAAGKIDKTVPLLEETLKIRRAQFGPDHSSTLAVMSLLGDAYRAAKLLDLATALHEETLRLQKATLGSDHPSTVTSINRLAGAYHAAGKVDLALPLYEEALKLTEAKRGREHPETVTAMMKLATAYNGARKLDQAIQLREEALKLRKATLGPDHPDTLRSLIRLAIEYQAAGKLDLSVPLCEELLKLHTKKLGPQNAASLHELANLYSEGLRFDLAIPLREELWRIRKDKLPQGDTTRIDAQNLLGLHLYFAGRFAEAETHLLATYRDSMSAKDFPKDWQKHYALRLVCLYVEWEKPAELAHWQAELNTLGGAHESWLPGASLRMLQALRFRAAELMLRDWLARRENSKSDDWMTYNAKSMLGAALLGQKRYADAETLLLDGYEGMKQRESTIAENSKVTLAQALDRLIDLYTATDKRDELNKWQAERSKYPPSTTSAPVTQ